MTATHPRSRAGEPKEGWDDVSQEGDRARMDARVFTGGQLFVFMTGSANFGPGTAAINSLAKTTATVGRPTLVSFYSFFIDFYCVLFRRNP